MGLADLLIMPIQRVPRYVLLLKEVECETGLIWTDRFISIRQLLKHMDANDPHRPLIEKAQCDVR